MRIDFKKRYRLLDYHSLQKEWQIKRADWEAFGEMIESKIESEQMTQL